MTDDQTETPDFPADADADADVIAAELEADAAAAAASKKSLGVERWVQLTFMVAAILFVWLFDHLIEATWYVFADPNEALVTVGAIVLAVLATFVTYRQPVIYSTVHDTVDELSRVSWPTRKETSSSTVIVVVTSVVAALMLFLFDSVWSAVTDLVYKV